MRLLGDNDLAVLIVAAVRAHVVRQLGGTATRAHGPGRSGDLAVGRTTGARGCTALFLLRNCHLEPLLLLRRAPRGDAGQLDQKSCADDYTTQYGTCASCGNIFTLREARRLGERSGADSRPPARRPGHASHGPNRVRREPQRDWTSGAPPPSGRRARSPPR